MRKPATTITPERDVQSRLDAARQGDRDAWFDIVKELGPRLRGYARARGAPDPDDVMQDVFLAAAEQLPEFEGDESAFRSWLFGIAYRQIANRHRVSGRESATDPEKLEPATVDDPHERLEADEEASAAFQAMHVLNTTERDVVLMRVVAELDTNQVAAAVGKEPGNVRVIQSRAMAKLRHELERTGYGSERSHG